MNCTTIFLLLVASQSPTTQAILSNRRNREEQERGLSRLRTLPQNVQVYRACWVISICARTSSTKMHKDRQMVITNFFNLLSQRGTVTLDRTADDEPGDIPTVEIPTHSTVLSSNTDFSCSLGLEGLISMTWTRRIEETYHVEVIGYADNNFTIWTTSRVTQLYSSSHSVFSPLVVLISSCGISDAKYI